MPRYTKPGLHKLVTQLATWINDSQDTLDNEESRDYPSNERIDSLTARIDALQAALDSLEEIE